MQQPDTNAQTSQPSEKMQHVIERSRFDFENVEEGAANVDTLDPLNYLAWLQYSQIPGQINTTLSSHAGRFVTAFVELVENSRDPNIKAFRSCPNAVVILERYTKLLNEASSNDMAYKAYTEVNKLIHGARVKANEFTDVKQVGVRVMKSRNFERDKGQWVKGLEAAVVTATDPNMATKNIIAFVISRLMSPLYNFGNSVADSLNAWIPVLVKRQVESDVEVRKVEDMA